jgi:hypothetical protein
MMAIFDRHALTLLMALTAMTSIAPLHFKALIVMAMEYLICKSLVS